MSSGGPIPGIAACIQLLAGNVPNVQFMRHAGRPLKIGIHEDLIAALVGAITPAELGRALCTYTRNKVYRSRLRAGAIRIDLNGEPAGIVTPEQASAVMTAQVFQFAPRKTPAGHFRHAGS